MIRIVAPEERHFTDFGWLQTYWLFSFSNYYDPSNLRHGALRVFNDDVVQPGSGFPTHPHQEMEITTIVLSGEITHEDSMGNRAVIKAGDVQRMSAGTGLTHSEFNLSKEPVAFYQIWIQPGVRRLEPSYDQRAYDASAWRGRLFPVAAGQTLPDVVTLHADATIYRASLDGGGSLEFEMERDRKVFVYLTAGQMEINGLKLAEKGQARAEAESGLELKAVTDSELVLIDVPG